MYARLERARPRCVENIRKATAKVPRGKTGVRDAAREGSVVRGGWETNAGSIRLRYETRKPPNNETANWHWSPEITLSFLAPL
jgi:hypothetical protein